MNIFRFKYYLEGSLSPEREIPARDGRSAPKLRQPTFILYTYFEGYTVQIINWVIEKLVFIAVIHFKIECRVYLALLLFITPQRNTSISIIETK